MKNLIYSRYERLWHWLQAFFILLLALTGFEIHGSYKIFGFQQAVSIHEFSGWFLFVLTVFTYFWDFTTGEWRQYKPTKEKLAAQIKYYTHGIFHGEPHPTKKTKLSKLNPLQRLAYLGLVGILIPAQIITGFFYMYYNNQATVFGWHVGILKSIAFWHVLGAFLILAFVIGHVYLTTTGTTVFSNIKAMITGWEEVEE